ncbi:Uncharacterised protein [Raoultella terrigena]|uniref:Uncharacterized protein n=1 Tax=Raoultella terrigena TaxID=577 RepID=A0A3P8J5K9_RAOTE|nr:Uncharacterised protein [Raoultella terrigena]
MMMRIETFDYQRGHVTEWHEHDGGQLYWLTTGIMVVETDQAAVDGHAGLRGMVSRRPSPQGSGAGPARRDKPLPSRINLPELPPTPGIYGTDSFIQALLERLCAGPRPGLPADYSSSLLSLLAAEIASAVQLPLQAAFADRSSRA